jgi:hypothetical protein
LKSILSSILIYWETISKIPKGILSRVRNICFQFLWRGRRESGGIPLVKWNRIDILKELRGWGLKNIFYFSKYLETKSFWRLIHNKVLWGVSSLLNISLDYRLRNGLDRQGNRGEMVILDGKAMIDAYPLLGD